MLTLRYFGPFTVHREGQELTLPTRPTARLLARLALEPGRRLRRDLVAREIWPETTWAGDTTSLRTALTMLRRTLGDNVIGADREHVWIEAGEVSTDRERFEILSRREGIETDSDRREVALIELAGAPHNYLEGWEADWIEAPRRAHARSVARAALGLSRLRLASGDYSEARCLALRSLAATPGNDHASAVAVRAAIALGERDEAQALAMRTDPSSEVRKLVQELAPGPLSAAPAPAPDLLFEAFESNLREDPEGAVRFLMANQSFWWRQSEMVRGKELLALAAAAPDLSDEMRARALMMLGMLHQRTSDYEAALAVYAAAEPLLAALDPSRILPLHSNRGFLFMEMRRYEESERAFDAAFATDEHTPAPPERTKLRRSYALINRAGLDWHLLRLDRAKAAYAEALSLAEGDEVQRAYVRGLVAANLAYVAEVEGDWPTVERQATVASEILTVRIDLLSASAVQSLVLLARCAQGETGLGSLLGRVPLDLVRCGMRRMALVVFDHVAEGFAFLGHGQAALELQASVTALRAELGHVRSPAEEVGAARLKTLAAQRPGSPVPSAPRAGYAEVAAWTAALGDEF